MLALYRGCVVGRSGLNFEVGGKLLDLVLCLSNCVHMIFKIAFTYIVFDILPLASKRWPGISIDDTILSIVFVYKN